MKSNLEDHLPEETYQEVETFFMDRGFPMGVIDTYKPWLVSNMVSQLMVQELGFTEGVDMYFLSKAQADRQRNHRFGNTERPARDLCGFVDGLSSANVGRVTD